MRAAKSLYENNLIHQFASSNSNKVYKYIVSLTKLHHIPDIMTDGTKSVTYDLDIANCFNQYFYSVFTKSGSTIPSNINVFLSAPNINRISFSITALVIFYQL